MSNEQSRTSKGSSRRKFLLAAGATGAATIAMPQVSRAQTVTWKYQSTWPTKDIFHEFAVDYAKKVNDMSGGRLKLDVLAAGAVVPAFQMQDAVHSGVLDGGHGVTAYWYGKHKAASLFGTPPVVRLGRAQHARLVLLRRRRSALQRADQRHPEAQRRRLPLLPMPTQPLGWFKKRDQASADDFKGMKYRTVGLSADLFKEMGAAVTILPGGEIVPAMDRGLIDAAEFNNPSSDILLGFPDVAKFFMVGSHHQQQEVLRGHLQQGQVQRACRPSSRRSCDTPPLRPPPTSSPWRMTAIRRISRRSRSAACRSSRTPESVLKAQLAGLGPR